MIFDKIVKKIIERKAGKFSARVAALKGLEPVAYIGSISGIIVAICKALQIDITEETVAQICAGATALFGAIKALSNYLKNKGK